jgi:uncharacterized protein (TIGR02271 family)
MTNETIVAIYDLPEHAAHAVRDLEAAGVPTGAITQHAKDGSTTNSMTTSQPRREEGCWANLFGGGQNHEHETSVYDRSLEDGSTIVAVTVPEEHLTLVIDILEQHHPIDIDERAATYNGSQTTTTIRATDAPPTSGTTGPDAADGDAIPLSEEELAVGKRAINRGTTRLRRFVVETPVEEHVSLRDETVSVERRPITDARPVSEADFTVKVIEMTETDEEAVVSKTARVKEEVVVRRAANERTETVRDTVRREDVEITKEPDAERSIGTAGSASAASTPEI